MPLQIENSIYVVTNITMRLLNKIEAIITPKKNKNDDCALKKKDKNPERKKKRNYFGKHTKT